MAEQTRHTIIHNCFALGCPNSKHEVVNYAEWHQYWDAPDRTWYCPQHKEREKANPDHVDTKNLRGLMDCFIAYEQERGDPTMDIGWIHRSLSWFLDWVEQEQTKLSEGQLEQQEKE